MYLTHYSLKSKPFQMSTDPNFLWLGEKHKEALATLKYAIVENKGILALTGDVGTGKTTLINALIRSLGNDTMVATIYDPSLEVLDFFNIVSFAFNMGRTFDSKGEFLIYFKRFLKEARARNRKVLLIIDEAQRITSELLEEIRLLSNLEDEHVRLLNIFFVGQNEFIDILNEYKNRALRQRITIRYHIEPLTLSETETYTRHRLKTAGAKSPIFSSGAIQEIFSFSNGYPRLINIICDHALLSGYVREIIIINADIIRECKEELQISSLNTCKNTDIPDDESESIHKIPEIPAIHRVERPGYWKIRVRTVVIGIVFLAVIGILAGYLFYNSINTKYRANLALRKDNAFNPGQGKKKDDLRASVTPVQEKKAYEVPDRAETGKVEDSRFYIVRSPEPKLFKKIDTREEEIAAAVPSEQVAYQADIGIASGGDKEPVPFNVTKKNEAGKLKTTPLKAKPVTVQKKTLIQERVKPDLLNKEDLSLQKDHVIDNKFTSSLYKKQATRIKAKSSDSVQETAVPAVSEKDKQSVNASVISESTPSRSVVPAKKPEVKKVVSNIEQKVVPAFRKGIKSEGGTGDRYARADLQFHLNAFLNEYCQTYEKEQLDKFVTFFTPDAMENGKSFISQLGQYRHTFETTDSMNYRIELKRYAIQEGNGVIRIEGIFHARAKFPGSEKWNKNSGPIIMELLAHKDSFQVRRLDY
ncbi:MAG: general secretion pathway protein A [Desulfobacteraceae bacterium Eth-SRB2]|nr:MAG: general secretion pathway protein A [Desulfobacteraceae bacterium Eth-SRB2]